MGCTSTLGIFLDLWKTVCGASRIPLPNDLEASRNSPNSPRKALRDTYSRLSFQIPWHNRGTLQHLIKLSDYEHISQRRVYLHEANILFLACGNKSVILNFEHLHAEICWMNYNFKNICMWFFYQHNTKAGGVCCNSKCLQETQEVCNLHYWFKYRSTCPQANANRKLIASFLSARRGKPQNSAQCRSQFTLWLAAVRSKNIPSHKILDPLV